MQHLSTPATTKNLLRLARRAALLLALGAAGPVWGQSFGPRADYAVTVQPYGVAVADVNGDQRPDLVVSNSNIQNASQNTGLVSVLLGLAGGGFGPKVDYVTGPSPYQVLVVDLNGDNYLDIVTANYNYGNSAGSVSVLPGLGLGSFGPKTDYPTGAGLSLASGDVNGDGRRDIVMANYGSNGGNTVSVLLGLATGGFGIKTDFPVSTGPSSIALADVNSDGRLDIVTTGNVGSVVSVLLGTGTGSFSLRTDYPTGSSPNGVVVVDVNGDNRPDIVTANLNGNSVSVLLGLATSGFGTKTDYPTGQRCRSVALGDVNGDNRLDIVTTNQTTNTSSVLLGQGAGSFGLQTDYTTGSFPVNVALADVNGDHRLDIVTANFSGNSASVLLNTGTFTPLATAGPVATDVSLYPNPAHDTFSVQLPAGLTPTQAELLNALGQVVRRPAVGSGSFRVETSGLTPGLYTLRLQAGGTALARRVVVE